jgi:hypothetical protein
LIPGHLDLLEDVDVADVGLEVGVLSEEPDDVVEVVHVDERLWHLLRVLQQLHLPRDDL